MRRASVLALMASLLLAFGDPSIAVSQQPTPLSLAPAIDGDDAEIRQTQIDQWQKQPKSLKVQGAVIDAAGKPIPSAKLFVTAHLGVRLEGVADADGKFQFETSGVGLYPVYVESADGKSAGISEFTRPSDGGPIDLKITLYPTKEVKLIVRNAKGEPIAGANCGSFFRQCIIARGKTDAEGQASFRIPPPLPLAPPERRDRTPTFYVFAAEYGIAVGPAPVVDGAIGDALEMRLARAEPLKVKTVDRDQKPVPGIPVAVVGMQVMIPGPRSAPPAGMGGGFAGANAYVNEPIPLAMDLRSYAKSDESGTATFGWFSVPESPELAARMPFGPHLCLRSGWRPSIATGEAHLQT